MAITNLSSSTPALNRTNTRIKNLTNSHPTTTVEKKTTFTIDQEIEALKNDIFKSLQAFQDPSTFLNVKILDNALMKRFIQLHMIDLPSSKPYVKVIQKTRSTALILINAYRLVQYSEVAVLLKGLIVELSEKGFDKTCLFHQIVYNNLIQPLIVKNTNKKIQTLFADPEVNSVLTFSQKIKDAYWLLSSILCPVTAGEFKPLIKNISLLDTSSNLRLFLDMRHILSRKHQGEFFDFINSLQSVTAKEEFIKLIAEPAINITKIEREQLVDIVKITFKEDKVDFLNLKISLITALSSYTKNIWIGMNWTYLEYLSDTKEAL